MLTSPTVWKIIQTHWTHWKNRRLSHANRNMAMELKRDKEFDDSLQANITVILLDNTDFAYPEAQAIAGRILHYLHNRSHP